MSNSNPSNYTTTYTQEFRHRTCFSSPPAAPPANHYDGGHASRTIGYDGNPIVYNPQVNKNNARSNYRQMSTILTGPDAISPQPVSSFPGHGPNTSFRLPPIRYHIPGYSGFVPGKQYRHADTYSKTTRKCVDTSSELYLEP